MTEPTTPAGRALLRANTGVWGATHRKDGREVVGIRDAILAIEEQARAECREADHAGQITQLGEMVDAARAEAEQARAEGRREAVREIRERGEVWGTKNGREFRIPLDILDAVAGLNASEPETEDGGRISRRGWHYPSCWRLWIEAGMPMEDSPCRCEEHSGG